MWPIQIVEHNLHIEIFFGDQVIFCFEIFLFLDGWKVTSIEWYRNRKIYKLCTHLKNNNNLKNI
jgi:hypothetical protein